MYHNTPRLFGEGPMSLGLTVSKKIRLTESVGFQGAITLKKLHRIISTKIEQSCVLRF